MIRVTGHSLNRPGSLLGEEKRQHVKENAYTTHKCIFFFLQQKKLFIWNMHYQYKLGDCKIYTVLVSSSRTQSFRRIKGTKPVLTEAEKLNFQTKQGRASQGYTLI